MSIMSAHNTRYREGARDAVARLAEMNGGFDLEIVRALLRDARKRYLAAHTDLELDAMWRAKGEIAVYRPLLKGVETQ